MAGHFRTHGQMLTLDLSLFSSGAMKGTVAMGAVSFEVLRVGGRTYLYLSQATFNFYRRSHNVPAAACALACGKFVLIPGGPFSHISLKSLSVLIDRNAPKAIKGAHKTGKNRKTRKNAPAPRVSRTTFDGQPAWELAEGKIEIFIATHSGFLLGMVKPNFGVFRFSEWNAVPPISAPQPRQVFGLGAG